MAAAMFQVVKMMLELPCAQCIMHVRVDLQVQIYSRDAACTHPWRKRHGSVIDGTEYHMYSSTALRPACRSDVPDSTAYASFYCTCTSIFLQSKHRMPVTEYTMNSWAVWAEIE